MSIIKSCHEDKKKKTAWAVHTYITAKEGAISDLSKKE